MDEWSKTLGKYNSNERAIEILKDIFLRIEEGNGISMTFSMPEK